MGIFFEKPTKGPDVVGGVWPISDRARLWNRAGATVSKGDVVQLAWTPGSASEIATNDDNSYIPGASNDTVWNTFVDPISDANNGSSIQRGGCFGIVLDTEILDDGYGWVKLFGLVEEARCIKVGTNHTIAGDPLTVTTANNLDGIVVSNEVVVATYMDTQVGLTNRTLRRVFLHQGMFCQSRGQFGTNRFV